MEDIIKLYEAVFYRKSVRKYKAEPLSMELMFDLQKELESLEPLLAHIPYALEMVSEEKVKGLFTIQAPHYLCFYSDSKAEGAYENAGYLMEQVALALAARGLGGCWLGAAKPPRPMAKSEEGLDYMVMIAFGIPDEEPKRRDRRQFRRKKLQEITDVAECAELLEAVRIAPSARNLQPWLITGREGELLFSRIKPPLAERLFMTTLNRIDMGIALLHFRLASAMAGLPISISLDAEQKSAEQPLAVPNGCVFSARVTWKK